MEKRKCKICKKEFIPDHHNQTICKEDHYIKCCICSKLILLKSYNISKYLKGKSLTCSKECAVELMKQTNLEKYGNICSAQSKTIREEINKANLEKYGSKSPFGNKIIQDKCIKKRLSKSSKEKEIIKSKVKQTNLEKYGNPNYNNSEKFKTTMQERYGVNYTNESEILKNKQQQTMLKRYGSKSSFSNKIIHAQMIESAKRTNLEKYGVPYTCQLEQCKNAGSRLKSKTNKNFSIELNNNNIMFTEEFSINKHKYSYDFKINDTLIEIDPTYTHNSTIGIYHKNKLSNPKDKYYHKKKSEIAEENGYQCIHIFDWDDKEKIINMLKPKQSIYARNCKIKEVDNSECDKFLNDYHLQNTCKGQTIRLGLYYNDKLFQIMTFGKPRYNKNYEYELLRLCTKSEYKIIGGAEKLFKYFTNTYNPKSIISYCDKAKFTGQVYNRLGMTLKKVTSPNCHWSKYNMHITNNLLLQRGYDQIFKTNYGKGTSNKDLMIENGWKEIYDCGQAVYEWYNK